MAKIINHKNLEMCIGRPEKCDDYLKLKVAGYYSQYNSVAVASRRGADTFFLAARGPKTDISDAQLLAGRYLVIGDRNIAESSFFPRHKVNPGDSWYWLTGDETLLEARLLIAGAMRIVVSCNNQSSPITRTTEYIQAKADGRLIIL